jgi:hypothetical protein
MELTSFKFVNDPEEIKSMWPILLKGIEKTMSYHDDGSTIENIYEDLLSKKKRIAFVFVDGQYKGFITFQVDSFRTGYVSVFNTFYEGKFSKEQWLQFEDNLKRVGVKGVSILTNRKSLLRRMKVAEYRTGVVEILKTF